MKELPKLVLLGLVWRGIHHEGHEVGCVEDRGWKIEDGKFFLRSSILDPPSSAVLVCGACGERSRTMSFPFAKASGNGPSCGSEPPGGVP